MESDWSDDLCIGNPVRSDFGHTIFCVYDAGAEEIRGHGKSSTNIFTVICSQSSLGWGSSNSVPDILSNAQCWLGI